MNDWQVADSPKVKSWKARHQHLNMLRSVEHLCVICGSQQDSDSDYIRRYAEFSWIFRMYVTKLSNLRNLSVMLIKNLNPRSRSETLRLSSTFSMLYLKESSSSKLQGKSFSSFGKQLKWGWNGDVTGPVTDSSSWSSSCTRLLLPVCNCGAFH